MASAPLRRASSMMERPSRTTELVRLTLKAPPQHSTFMFHSTSSAPQALMMSSICIGCSGSSPPLTSGGRTSRQP